jgi:putative ABC transport system permease protein
MNFLLELRYTLKLLLKNYWYSLLCCSVLAVGVGIVLPLYGLAENLQMKTPELPDGRRYVAFIKNRTNLSTFDAFHYRYFQDNANSFEQLYAWQNVSFTVSDGEYAEAVRSAVVEPKLLQVPQTPALRGRLLIDEDAQVGADPVALISYELWQSYYTGREDIIGYSSRINGEARTIVGVMPPRYRFPLAQQLWVPMSVPTNVAAGSGAEDLLIFGKLKPGVTTEEANEEVALLRTTLQTNFPEFYRHITRAAVVPYIEVIQTLGVGSQTLVVIFVSMVLLVAFNIGNLFMARGEERVRELSIRGALGAGAWRIALTLLLESLVVCCCGLAIGWLVAYFALESIHNHYLSAAIGPSNFHMTDVFWWDMGLNGHMLSLSAGVVFAVWLISGGLPAWRLARSNLSELLASGGKGLGDNGVTRWSKALVNMQLIFGCALLTLGTVETLDYYTSTPTATANAEQLYRGTLELGGTKLKTHGERQQYLDNLALALAAEQGVQQVAFASATPGDGGPYTSYNLEEQDLRVNDRLPGAYMLAVSPVYFTLFNLPLLEGRNFDAGDTATATPVVIIDQRLASKYWPNASALGKRIQLNSLLGVTWYTVIGVSESTIQEGLLDLGEAADPVIYLTTSQTITDRMRAIVNVGTVQTSPVSLFRAAATKADREIPIVDMITLREQEVRDNDNEQFESNILVSFVLISLFMTGTATYGLAARLTGRRRVETGIRMALGANRSAAMLVFIKAGLKTVIIGLSLGSIFAIGMVYAIYEGGGDGLLALNWLVVIALSIAAFLGTMVMLANFLPARKLVKMEPAEALRYE